jgi:DNA invertase Pin-like site-specific DNA recombinase
LIPTDLSVDLYLDQQGLDTSTPFGRAMVFAEFERSMIRERVMAELAGVKAERTRLGRPSRLRVSKE